MSEEGQVYARMKRMQTISDARVYMQKLINAYDKNEISKDKARTLGYLIKIYIATVDKGDLEERVEEIEKLLEERKIGGVL